MLQFPAQSAAQLRARAAIVARRDSGNAGGLGAWLNELADNLLAQRGLPGLAASLAGAEHRAFGDPGGRSPGVNRDFDPRQHGYGAGPPAVRLPDVFERERCHLGAAEPTAQEHHEDWPRPAALSRCSRPAHSTTSARIG